MYRRQKFTRLCAGWAVIAMLMGASISTTHAADEDIDIPYTDTYGYVYDPQTGTYIKQESQAATGSTATDDTATSTASVPDTDDLPPASQVQTSPRPEQSSTHLTIVILAVLLLGIVFGLVSYSRRQKKTVPGQH